MSMVREVQRLIDAKSDLRLDDAVATGPNTVTVGSSTVPVTLPAITPVVAGDFCQVLTQGANRVIVGHVATPFTNLSFGNGWASWAWADGAGYQKVGGVVHLDGLIDADLATDITVALLPDKFKPARDQLFIARTSTGYGEVRVLEDGAVQAIGGYTLGNSEWVSLCGLKFIAGS